MCIIDGVRIGFAQKDGLVAIGTYYIFFFVGLVILLLIEALIANSTMAGVYCHVHFLIGLAYVALELEEGCLCILNVT
jgi:uncharacterized membrane protein